MLNNRVIPLKLVCKCSMHDNMKILYEYWNRQFDLPMDDYNTVPSELIIQSLIAAESQTIKTKMCKAFHCPAYNFCPFSGEIAPGIIGRKSKKKLDVDISNLNKEDALVEIKDTRKSPESSLSMKDEFEVEVIYGDESIQ